MTSQARKYFNLNEHDNTALDVKNLEHAAIQRDQNWEKEETAYIFADGSAIICCAGNDYHVETNYGLSKDNEQL
jgi:hypothetical protein